MRTGRVIEYPSVGGKPTGLYFPDVRFRMPLPDEGADAAPSGVRSKPLMGGGVPPPETARTDGQAGPDERRHHVPPLII
jgi:hypothetical protein